MFTYRLEAKGTEYKRQLATVSSELNAFYISSDSQTVPDKVRLLTFQFNSQSENTDSDHEASREQ